VRLIHGDCLEKLKDISDMSVDMVLADLPYGTTACKWDTNSSEAGCETLSRPVPVVLDLFGGSGSTLIACEKTGRCCFMMDIDPHYCDIIVARWEKYTGKKAERIDG
jgi:DNA modification methylase